MQSRFRIVFVFREFSSRFPPSATFSARHLFLERKLSFHLITGNQCFGNRSRRTFFSFREMNPLLPSTEPTSLNCVINASSRLAFRGISISLKFQPMPQVGNQACFRVSKALLISAARFVSPDSASGCDSRLNSRQLDSISSDATKPVGFGRFSRGKSVLNFHGLHCIYLRSNRVDLANRPCWFVGMLTE